MNVLITGVTGFIGSNLAINLAEEGYKVYGLIRHTSRMGLEPLKPVLDRIRLIEGDLTTCHSVNDVVKSTQPQCVFHLGALTPVRLSFENPFPYIATNFEGTVNIVHAILEKAPKAMLLYASTAEVYGWQENQEPIKETAPLNPASPYAVTKEAADQYVRMAMKLYGLRATILRPNNTYGRDRKGFLTEYLIDSMLRHETCYVGAPESIRDYMFISDHVQAYRLALESEKALGEVFNVSPGNPVTNKELAEMVKEITEFEGNIVYGSYPPGYPQRPAQWDPQYLTLDNTKIQRVLRWKPTVTLKEGLEKTVKMWKGSS
jgi:nucleoside-diphosphate-sugar epimerase